MRTWTQPSPVHGSAVPDGSPGLRLGATVESRGKSRVPEGSQSLNPLGGSGKGSGVLTAPSLQEGSLRPASSQPAQILPVRGDGDSGTGGSPSPAGACGAS